MAQKPKQVVHHSCRTGLQKGDIRRQLSVEESNRVNSFESELNQFADLSEEEFKAGYSGFKLDTTRKSSSSEVNWESDLVENQQDAVDWRTKGAVTPIAMKGQCGDSPYFSTTTAVEAAHFFKAGKLEVLSVQQIIDCSQSFGNYGCNGGFMNDSLQYIYTVGGIESIADYPYAGRDNFCKFNKSKVTAKISGYSDISMNRCDLLKSAVSKQPVASAMDASGIPFYKGGIYNVSTCRTVPNAGIGIVGYGVENGTKYWILKNYWGTSWGEDGYMRILREDEPGVIAPGLCGICVSNSIPTI